MSLAYHACDRTSQDLVSQPGDKTCNGSNTSCVRPIFQACSIQRTRKAQDALSRTCNHDARGQLSRKTEKNKQSSTLLFRGAYGIDTNIWFLFHANSCRRELYNTRHYSSQPAPQNTLYRWATLPTIFRWTVPTQNTCDHDMMHFN